MTKEKKHKPKIIGIHDRAYEVIGENRFTARIFEAILARGPVIMDALDRAKIASFSREEGETERPIYKHTILLGRDDKGHNLRASVAVFSNSVVVQTMKEI